MNRMQTEFIGRVFYDKEVPGVSFKVLSGGWDHRKKCWMYHYKLAGYEYDHLDMALSGLQLRKHYEVQPVEATALFDLLYD